MITITSWNNTSAETNISFSFTFSFFFLSSPSSLQVNPWDCPQKRVSNVLTMALLVRHLGEGRQHNCGAALWVGFEDCWVVLCGFWVFVLEGFWCLFSFLFRCFHLYTSGVCNAPYAFNKTWLLLKKCLQCLELKTFLVPLWEMGFFKVWAKVSVQFSIGA